MPTSTITYQRNYPLRYRIQLLDSIRIYINTTAAHNRQRTIDEISLSQRKITNGIAGFRYRGIVYNHTLQDAPSFKLKLLDTSLEQSFIGLLTNWQANEDRASEVDSALITALNQMHNVNDLYEMLPECLHNQLPTKDADGADMTQDEVNNFAVEHTDGIALIKYQLVMKSLKG